MENVTDRFLSGGMFGFEVENEPVFNKFAPFSFWKCFILRTAYRLLRTCVYVFVFFYKLCRYSQFIVSRFGNQCAILTRAVVDINCKLVLIFGVTLGILVELF